MGASFLQRISPSNLQTLITSLIITLRLWNHAQTTASMPVTIGRHMAWYESHSVKSRLLGGVASRTFWRYTDSPIVRWILRFRQRDRQQNDPWAKSYWIHVTCVSRGAVRDKKHQLKVSLGLISYYKSDFFDFFWNSRISKITEKFFQKN